MPQLSKEDILKLAKLARLEVTNQEIANYTKELNDILEYVSMLQQVDTTGLEPTYQVTGLVNVTRPDEIIDYECKPEQLLLNAPEIIDNQLKVKRMVA